MNLTGNTLYLFHPAKSWQYCGGATIICASSLEHAIELGNAAIKNNEIAECLIDDNAGFVVEETETRIYEWTFVESFMLAQPLEIGIVFSEANYA